MSLIPIYCDICGEHIASADMDGLRLPIAGAMFKPREAGFPEPFPAEATWEFLRCPFGPHRPFIEEHLLQVGPLTPGNRPVLDLTAVEEPESDGNGEGEQAEAEQPEQQPLQPQVPHNHGKRRRGRK